MYLLDRNRSVLLVIDLQPGFYPPRRRDVDRAALERVSTNVAWLTGVSAALAVPVIVTEEDPARNGATHPGVIDALESGSRVITKTSFGVAGQEEIMTAIEATGAEDVVIVGGETDICVCHSALGLCDAGYRVAVVSDAVYSPGAAQEHGLRRMFGRGVELVSAKQVLFDWLPRLGEVRRFRREYPILSEPVHFNL